MCSDNNILLTDVFQRAVYQLRDKCNNLEVTIRSLEMTHRQRTTTVCLSFLSLMFGNLCSDTAYPIGGHKHMRMQRL